MRSSWTAIASTSASSSVRKVSPPRRIESRQALELGAAVARADDRAVARQQRRQVLLRALVGGQQPRLATGRGDEVQVVRDVGVGPREQDAVRGEVADDVPALELHLDAGTAREVEDDEVEVGAVALGVGIGERGAVRREGAERMDGVCRRERPFGAGEVEPVALVAAHVAPERQPAAVGRGDRARDAFGLERELVGPAAGGRHQPDLRDAGDIGQKGEARATVQPLRRVGAANAQVRGDLRHRYHGISTPSRQNRPVAPASSVDSCSAIFAACSGATLAWTAHVGAHPAGVHRVDEDAVAGELARGVGDERVHRGLRDAVRQRAAAHARGELAHRRGDDDDPRVAGGAQRRQQRLREAERRQHVDREAVLDIAAERVATPPRRSTPALCTSTCSCGASCAACAAAAATPSAEARSPHTGSPPRSIEARRASISVRAWQSTRAPSDFSAVTIAGPSPRPVPVTSAVCPSRSMGVA